VIAIRMKCALGNAMRILPAGLLFWSLAASAISGSLGLGEAVVFAQSAIGASMIAFGGLNSALDGAAAAVAAVLRLEQAMAPVGALSSGTREAAALPACEIRFRDVTFGYPGGAPVLDGFNLTMPAGSSLAIVGQNGAGKTTLAKLLCRLYDPQSGAIEIAGLISDRFSTVRHADRICVLEHGRVTELGTHDELMAKGGRYRTMFDLQAKRFLTAEDEQGATYDVLT